MPMPERVTIAKATESPWDPNLRLAEIFKRKKPGLQILAEPIFDQDILLENRVVLTVDSVDSQQIEDWDKVAETRDFVAIEQAASGNIRFFQESFMSSDELIISRDPKGFNRFYGFVRGLAYYRASEDMNRWGTIDQVKDFKLQSRKDWAPNLSPLQKKLSTNYVNSLLSRLYNLVTTGEEKASVWDRILDRVY